LPANADPSHAGGLANLTYIPLGSYKNCYKFDAKLSSQNAVKSSRGYFGNLAKFAIIARK